MTFIVGSILQGTEINILADPSYAALVRLLPHAVCERWRQLCVCVCLYVYVCVCVCVCVCPCVRACACVAGNCFCCRVLLFASKISCPEGNTLFLPADDDKAHRTEVKLTAHTHTPTQSHMSSPTHPPTLIPSRTYPLTSPPPPTHSHPLPISPTRCTEQ